MSNNFNKTEIMLIKSCVLDARNYLEKQNSILSCIGTVENNNLYSYMQNQELINRYNEILKKL